MPSSSIKYHKDIKGNENHSVISFTFANSPTEITNLTSSDLQKIAFCSSTGDLWYLKSLVPNPNPNGNGVWVNLNTYVDSTWINNSENPIQSKIIQEKFIEVEESISNFNHDDTKNIKGGAVGEYNHITDDELSLLNGINNIISNGATGTFTSQDGKTITVTSGFITSIV
jgi:hypothetical protein